jgi:hypothetical protein
LLAFGRESGIELFLKVALKGKHVLCQEVAAAVMVLLLGLQHVQVVGQDLSVYQLAVFGEEVVLGRRRLFGFEAMLTEFRI